MLILGHCQVEGSLGREGREGKEGRREEGMDIEQYCPLHQMSVMSTCVQESYFLGKQIANQTTLSGMEAAVD